MRQAISIATLAILVMAASAGAQTMPRKEWARNAAVNFAAEQASAMSATVTERDDHYRVPRCAYASVTAACRIRWWNKTTKCSAIARLRLDPEGDGGTDFIVWSDQQRCRARR